MNRTGYKKAVVFVLVLMFLGGQVLAAGGGRGRRRGPGFGFGAYGGPETGSFRSPMAYGRGLMSGQHGGMIMARVLRRLDLTEEQRERIKDILESARDISESGREAVADATKTLHTAVTESADETAIREAAVNLGKVIGDRAVSRAATMASIKEVLTEEQLEQLQQMKDSESRDDLDGIGIRGRGLRRRSQRGVSDRYPDRPRRGAGRFGRDPERQGRGLGAGPGAGLRIDRLIEKVDTDGDGALTAEELEAFRKKVEDRSR